MKGVDYRKLVGRTLTTARQAVGWPQVKLAAEYGIGQGRPSRWERGINYPDP